MKLFAAIFAVVCLFASPLFAVSLEELRDAIDNIEFQIDDIDLDQDADDIRSSLNDIKAALEELKGEQTVNIAPDKWRPQTFKDYTNAREAQERSAKHR
jgi:hypothetical protein